MTAHSELLAIRHGESEWNLRGRWQGQADPPLTSLGVRQAEIAADALSSALRDADDHWRTPAIDRRAATRTHRAFDLPAFDLVVSSDLQRARRTAEIIAKQLGAGEVVADEALRERKAGPWEGLTRAEIDEGWPGDVVARRWPLGFESEDSIARRLLPALQRHLSVCGRVLLVGHAGVLKTIDARVGLGDERVPNLAGRWFWLDGAAADAQWTWDQLEARNRVELVSSDVDLMIE